LQPSTLFLYKIQILSKCNCNAFEQFNQQFFSKIGQHFVMIFFLFDKKIISLFLLTYYNKKSFLVSL